MNCSHIWFWWGVRHKDRQTGRQAWTWGLGRRLPSPQEVGPEGRKRGHGESEGKSGGKEGNGDQVLKKCKDSPPDAVPRAPHFLNLTWGPGNATDPEDCLTCVCCGHLEWEKPAHCGVCFGESPPTPWPGHLRAAVTKPQWVMAEDQCEDGGGGRGGMEVETLVQVYDDSQSHVYLTGLRLHSRVTEKEGWRVQHQVWEQAAGWRGGSSVLWRRDSKWKSSELAGQQPHPHWLRVAHLQCAGVWNEN